MAIRILKTVLVVFIGLQGALYVAGNLANWNSGLAAVGYVLGMQGHEVYGNHIFLPITNPALVTLAFLIIIFGEFLIAALSLTGAWHLWKARNADAESFNSAKTFAILGAGMAMVLWLGGFVVIGGALFQMWQTQIGTGSFEGAFIYGATSAVVLLFVNSPDS
jgi:predicted small integral membrane protein